jgi:outer membrane receptor protein involved in Fe transport
MSLAMPAYAQDEAQAEDETATEDVGIVVTAQRRAESLQDVPIAVSAFDAEALEKQQIENSSDLQLTLPNVTFTKGNFTGSSFTIRGIGDLCVGVSCDSATAIHLDGTPLLATRLFETEFFDMERIEVLRGPQGTLFGRNATSGVVNLVPNRPNLNGFSAAADVEYGNYESVKVKGMVNVALADTIGFRLSGFYLNRDGYTTNLFDGSDLDGRDMYAVRGSLRFQPTDTTTIDLMGFYFKENDNRMRIQKQLCQRDPTGVLGCLPGRRDYGVTNGNASFVGVLTSREFLAANGIPTAFALGSLYGPDAYSGVVNPADPRVVNTDFNPEYASDEQQYQARLEQEFGNYSLQVTGFYHEATVDSRQDYNLSVQNRAGYTAGLTTLQNAAAGLIPGLPASYFTGLRNAVIPNGAAGLLCTSDTEETGTGAYGGFRNCAFTPLDYDRSNQKSKDWSVEAILSSDNDGPFNFLVGGIYADFKMSENSYYVNSFGIDYLTGLLGTFNALGRAGLAAIPGAQPPPPGYLGTPFFRNNTDQLNVKSYGLFGEAYYEFNDQLKLTAGIRYNNDKKSVRARSTLASFLVPNTATAAFGSPYVYGFAVTGAPTSSRLQPFDADPATPCSITSTTTSGVLGPSNISGCELWQERTVKFNEFTGRAVLDYQITPDNLIYASYSRGYKSGGVNPPLQPIFAVPESFSPEIINAFEIGSKNSLANGRVTLNATAFYYKYKGLQLSRIVARTSVNDNVDADIYGIELESVMRPVDNLAINIGASYLKTEVTSDKFLGNPRDPSGGRADAVIIKDITNGANCAVTSNSGNTAGVNSFVNTVNSFINAGAVTGNAGANLQPTAPFPTGSGLSANGAFSICAALSAAAGGAFAGGGLTPAAIAALGGVTVELAGVPVNIRGNELPQAPEMKFNIGAQYDIDIGNGWMITPRVDYIYTGKSYGNIFNGSINRIKGYSQINAQIQMNGPDDKWFLRAFVQNVTNNDSITGLYVTDQSSGLFTNIFTLEPRRFGVAAGVKF